MNKNKGGRPRVVHGHSPLEIRQLVTDYCADFMEAGEFDGAAYLKLLAYATTQRKPEDTRCTVCTHEGRRQIEIGLARSVPQKTLAARFGLSHDAICRHAANHLMSPNTGQ